MEVDKISTIKSIFRALITWFFYSLLSDKSTHQNLKIGIFDQFKKISLISFGCVLLILTGGCATNKTASIGKDKKPQSETGQKSTNQTNSSYTSQAFDGTTREKVITKTHSKRPEWTFQTSGELGGTDYYRLVGMSGYSRSEKQSRETALNDARSKLVQYIGTEISAEKFKRDYSRYDSTKKDEKITSEYKSFIRTRAGALLRQIEPQEWYIKKVRRYTQDKGSSIQWKSHVLIEIPRQNIEEALKEQKEERKNREKHRLQGATENGIYFRNETQYAEGIKKQLLNKFSENDLIVKELDTVSSDSEFIKIKNTLNVSYQGTVRGDFHSQRLSYAIKIIYQPASGNERILKTFRDSFASAGVTKQAAIQRGQEQIVNQHWQQIKTLFTGASD